MIEKRNIPLFKVNMNPEAKNMVAKVLDSGYIGEGEVVKAFEASISEEIGTYKPAFAVSSATHGLDLVYHLLDIGPGDKVITTPMTCTATNAQLVTRGAEILWADVNPLTGNISPDDVGDLVKNEGVKAIVAVDWAGRPCKYEALKKHGIPVVQDAAHSWLQPDIGNSGGDYVVFSFQAIKHLTCGDGGAILAPYIDQDRLRLLRWYGLDRESSADARCRQQIAEFGYKYHMNDIAAAIGLSNIPNAGDDVIHRRTLAMRYSESLAELPFLNMPDYDPSCSYWLFTVLVDDQQRFMWHLKEHGIDSSLVHMRNDKHPPLKRFKRNDLQGLDYFSSHEVCIPIGWWVTETDQEYIVDVIHKYKP